MLVRIGLAAAFTGLMAFFSLRSSTYLHTVPWMPHWLGNWADHHGIFRNTVGFFVFGLTMLLLLGTRAWHLATLCVFATAVEVAQIWIPTRRYDWKDIVASVAGLLLAWPIAWLLARRWRTAS